MIDFTRFLAELWIARWAIVQGLGMTVLISSLAISLGSVLGVGVGLTLSYGHVLPRLAVRGLVDFVRGVPVFVLILACFYLSALIGVHFTAFEAGVFALTVFCSTHVGENLRGALQALPKGQTEAAKAIGLSFRQAFLYVLIPQAMRQAMPTWINTATEMVKASTLLSVIGVVELLLTTKEIISRNFLTLEFYFFAGLIYFLVDFSIERIGRSVERRVALPS